MWRGLNGERSTSDHPREESSFEIEGVSTLERAEFKGALFFMYLLVRPQLSVLSKSIMLELVLALVGQTTTDKPESQSKWFDWAGAGRGGRWRM